MSGSANSCQQCDGERHTCQRCAERHITCTYDVEPGISHFTSLRRKHDGLEAEVTQLHRSIGYIRTCSDQDARMIFRRIRDSRDPLDVAKSLGVDRD